MLWLLSKDLVPRLARASTRCLSQTSATLPSTPQKQKPAYFVPRNSQGNLPVYTDVRNNGGRYFVLIRNIDGNAEILAKDLENSLFANESKDRARIKIQTVRSKNLIISGGRWKNQVIEWLKERGF
ncbi:hypothetical protein BYT27DRAFT_6906483 [Phlegmacium glaucopus]|nr:hypothetical protein BYT27DRAFT_6906483 [Phlegmacium glaucopus]